MTKEEEYRDRYYDERFSVMTTLLNSHMLLITEKLEKIEKQTTKTNGRVTDLEGFKIEAQRVIDTREINCPVVDMLESKIENALTNKYADLHFVLKHPKLFIGAIVVLVILAFATFLDGNPFRIFDKPVTESIR